ncbi:Crp/Fnr family transcriptional regulator [Chryseobacterium angstadtii]|uniref:Crp/Fnr family transcriptional regulator n=1 Tax=Chryseobacterium angstadtii TaxID=558151 RepID=UPI00065B0764|nr:Crp/Fnr family transcriptional regulator [Chryseobacterium angstadtii]
MNYEEFIKIYFEENSFLNKKDRDKLTEMIRIVSYPTNKIILPRGEKSNQVGIISKGLIRGYDKSDRTVWLLHEDNVYGLTKTASLEYSSSLTYETLEETTLFLFNYPDLENTIREYPNVAALMMMFWKNMTEEVCKNYYVFLHSTPEERYLHLLNQDSKLILRVKSKDIATYLGIHPASLSRLKKRHFNPSHNPKISS